MPKLETKKGTIWDLTMAARNVLCRGACGKDRKRCGPAVRGSTRRNGRASANMRAVVQRATPRSRARSRPGGRGLRDRPGPHHPRDRRAQHRVRCGITSLGSEHATPGQLLDRNRRHPAVEETIAAATQRERRCPAHGATPLRTTPSLTIARAVIRRTFPEADVPGAAGHLPVRRTRCARACRLEAPHIDETWMYVQIRNIYECAACCA